MEEGAIVYCDSKFVGVNNIVSYKASDFSLEGDLLHKYSIGQVVGFVSILPLQQSVEPTSFKVSPGESVSLLNALTDPEADPPACIAPNPVITYADSPVAEFQYDGVGTISGNSFTANSTISDDRIVELTDIEPSPEEKIYGVKINIYVTKLDDVNVDPVEGSNPEYLGVQYDTPPHGTNFKIITGYIVLNIQEANINFMSDENGH